jgi:hypothetical protein
MTCRKCGCTQTELCEKHAKKGYAHAHFRIANLCSHCMPHAYWCLGWGKLPLALPNQKSLQTELPLP